MIKLTNLWRIIIPMVLLSHFAEAYIRFMPKEKLIETSPNIVLVQVIDVSDTGRRSHKRGVKVQILENKLEVIESIKGSLPPKTHFSIKTVKGESWIEDNVELPPKGSIFLLFLKKNDQREYRPVNGIQGVWPLQHGEPVGAGYGMTLKQVREAVRQQTQKNNNGYSSEEFDFFIDDK
ncbi:hypothetical protein [Sulfurovum sp.]|jgi:hypothetical protein|uniref:hypothetical protein n=1 Tax=Sulfurovum sp. TaxID=1969726 RepID=UPI002A370C33|nr:hypothetical protein [Sulfurovum sp.]MDY0402349.1 hypothetical protein [Sulfurovum sp.]